MLEGYMKREEIKEIAKQHGIRVGNMKKSDLIRTIQEKENNSACFAHGMADRCGQDACLWREDCV